MPVDNKRITGPETSTSFAIYSKSNIKSQENKSVELLNLNNVRRDGRTHDKHRKIYLKVGVVTKAKGSAYVEVGDTKVVVTVFDPREIPRKNEFSVQGRLYCEFKYATYSCGRRRQPIPDAEEKALSSALCRALQPAVFRHEFPNFQVDVYAFVLENGGSCLSTAIICAGLALADAGVPMYDLITAVTVGVSGNTIIMDPTDWEERICNSSLDPKNPDETNPNREHGVIVMSMLSAQQQVSEFFHNGCLEFETIENATKLLIEANKIVVPLVQQCLVKRVTRSLNQKSKDKEK